MKGSRANRFKPFSAQAERTCCAWVWTTVRRSTWISCLSSPHSSRRRYFISVLFLIAPSNFERVSSTILSNISPYLERTLQALFSTYFRSLFPKFSLSSNKMPVATSAGGEARLKAFKNRGKDTEVNFSYIFTLSDLLMFMSLESVVISIVKE